MSSSVLSRRPILQLAGAAALPLSSGLLGGPAQAAAAGPLTPAYNVNLPPFDPTGGFSAGNTTHPAIYQAIFVAHIAQGPDTSLQPRALTHVYLNTAPHHAKR